jgi:hypothetical protein
MEYLANPFNQSINQPPDDNINTVFNILSLTLFYYIVASFVYNLYEIREQESSLEGEYDSKIISQYIPDIVYDNVFNDETVDNKIKHDLVSLLNINSLDRHYILYYIFKLRGAFNNGSVDINTYAYYKTVLNDWRNIYFVDETYPLPMNLDSSPYNSAENTLENNYQIVIDNLIYDCNIAHIRFLSWLFYSGIYNYLMDNSEIKKMVLNNMNENKILIGNLFLKYQILLLDIENLEEKRNFYKMEPIKEESNLEEEQPLEAEYIDHSNENENELKNRPIDEDFSDMNEITFAYKLMSSVKSIAIRSIISTWKIVKEELDELFHPVLG